jgi:hypothetical protein
MRAKKPLKERFEPKYTVLTELGCWRWTGCKNEHGYGYINVDRKPKLAHRLSYELHKGAIRAGQVLDHYLYPGVCIGPSCCNPAHLKPTSRSANSARNAHARKTHCPHGHEYSENNTFYAKTGDGGSGRRRHCRTCQRMRADAWRQANPEKMRAQRRRSRERKRSQHTRNRSRSASTVGRSSRPTFVRAASRRRRAAARSKLER